VTRGGWGSRCYSQTVARSEVSRFDHAALGSFPAGLGVWHDHAGGSADAGKSSGDYSAPTAWSLHIIPRCNCRTIPAGRSGIAPDVAPRGGRVAFKTVSGNIGSCCRIVWATPGNYYIVLAKRPREHVVLYKYEGGVPVNRARGRPSRCLRRHAQFPLGVWNTFRVVFQDRLFPRVPQRESACLTWNISVQYSALEPVCGPATATVFSPILSP